MIDVCIVDDSATVRHLLSKMIDRQPDFRVKAQACSAEEAHDLVKSQKFDVMTLDVVMPGKNGLDFLKDLAVMGDLPTIVISSLAQRDSEVESVAYSRGADYCIFKPKSKADMGKFESQLTSAIRTIANRRPKTEIKAKDPAPAAVATKTGNLDIIAIAASTGGIPATEIVLSYLHEGSPPVIVTQHLRADALETLALRMNRRRSQDIALAQDGEVLKRGTVRYAAPGHHLTVLRSNGQLRVKSVKADPAETIVPCADPMFKSVAIAGAKRAAGVVLTGMGSDGAFGLLDMRQAGGVCFGEAEDSCVVYGMPKAAMKAGAVEHEMSSHEIGQAVAKL